MSVTKLIMAAIARLQRSSDGWWRKRAIRAGVGRVAFDRSGFKYHGRVKALADAARDAGLVF